MKQQINVVVDAHPVASFFVLAYAISWVAWLGPVLGLQEPLATLGFLIGGYGPFIAAATVTWLGSDSIQAWARQIVDWRVAPRWYLAVIAVPLVAVTLTSAGLTVVGTTVDPRLLPGRISLVLVSFVTIALIGGGNEEPGWRGLALPNFRSDTRQSRRRCSSVPSGRSGTSRCWRPAPPRFTGWHRSSRSRRRPRSVS